MTSYEQRIQQITAHLESNQHVMETQKQKMMMLQGQIDDGVCAMRERDEVLRSQALLEKEIQQVRTTRRGGGCVCTQDMICDVM